MPTSDIQACCFSGLPFKGKLFRRRDPVYTHVIPSAPSTDRVVRVIHVYTVFQALNVVQKDCLCLGSEKGWSCEKVLLPPYSEGGRNHPRASTALSPEVVNTIESQLDDLNRELRFISLEIHGMSTQTSSFYSGITLLS